MRYLHFCPDFLGYVENDKKAMVNFKLYGVTNWIKIQQ